MSRPPFDRETFLSEYNLPDDALEQTGLGQSDLEDIYHNHSSNTSVLETTANYVAARLRQVPEVHSIKIRIKDPAHLVEKIIRKKLDDPELDITPENYKEKITDLIGVRALHLFKEDWMPIHDFVDRTWTLHEQPTANVRKGDPDEYTQQFKEKGCRIHEHKYGYRSVHYLIESLPERELFITELQVRTIFEEGWSEIDHRIRYPYDVGNLLLSQLSAIHNRLAGSADEIGSFIQILKRELKARDGLIEQAAEEHKGVMAELTSYIQKLELSNQEKTELQNRLKALETDVSREDRVRSPFNSFAAASALDAVVRSAASAMQFPKIDAAALVAAHTARELTRAVPTTAEAMPVRRLEASDKSDAGSATSESSRRSPAKRRAGKEKKEDESKSTKKET